MDAKFPYLKFVIDSAYSHFIRFRSYVRKFSVCIITLFDIKRGKTTDQKYFEDFTINLCCPNPHFIDQNDFPLCNVMYETFTPKEGVKISAIVDHNGVIWYGKKPLELALIVHKDERPYMINVSVTEDETRYFLKSEDTWKEINSEEFNRNLQALRESVKITDVITLNGDYPLNTGHWIVKESKSGDTNQVAFSPQVGYEAKAVFADEKEVWRAEHDDQHCLVATVFKYSYYYILCSIAITSDPLCAKESIDVLYFKNADGWVEIDRDEYLAIAESKAPWFSRFETIDLHEMEKVLKLKDASYAMPSQIASSNKRLSI